MLVMLSRVWANGGLPIDVPLGLFRMHITTCLLYYKNQCKVPVRSAVSLANSARCSRSCGLGEVRAGARVNSASASRRVTRPGSTRPPPRTHRRNPVADSRCQPVSLVDPPPQRRCLQSSCTEVDREVDIRHQPPFRRGGQHRAVVKRTNFLAFLKNSRNAYRHKWLRYFDESNVAY